MSSSEFDKNAKSNDNSSVVINIDLDSLDDTTNTQQQSSCSSSNKNNSVNKVRLKDTKKTSRNKSLNYSSHVEEDNSLLDLDDSFLFPSSSDYFPTKNYPNDEALRMSEERLLERLKDPPEDESPDEHLHFSNYTSFLERRNSLPDKHENMDSLDEVEKEEMEDVFAEVHSSKINFPRTKTPSPVAGGGRPSQLSFGKLPPPFGKAGSVSSSSIWMSIANDDDYLKHECIEKCSSPLHLAVKTGNVDEIEILLETGANPNGKDCEGRTPLHWAVCAGICSKSIMYADFVKLIFHYRM
jgi:hypothetical protein